MSIRRTVGFIVLALSLTAVIPLAAAEESGHGDPVASVVLWLAIVLVAAKIGGDLVSRIGQPAVLGELLAGIVLGNMVLVGFAGFEPIKMDPTMDMLARLGVLVLLFEVGLESTEDFFFSRDQALGTRRAVVEIAI
jgi:Kef-type K+ transport system membrane component KefB